IDFATFGRALTLEGSHWSALTPIRPLRSARLIHVHDERSLLTSRLSIDERVLHYLAGVNYLDPRLQSLVRGFGSAGPLARSQRAAVDSAVRALESCAGRMLVQLAGDDRAAQREVARMIAEHWGLGLRILRGGDLPASRTDRDSLAALWNRE